MDQYQIEAEARIAALETMVSLLYNVILTTANLSAEQIAAMERQFMDTAGLATISQSDPVASDDVSTKVRQNIKRLLDGARTSRH